MAKDLLQVIPMPSTKGSIPPFVGVSVHAEAAPFLVTGTKSFLWVHTAKKGFIRSMVRSENFNDGVFLDVVSSIAKKGSELMWGNVFDFSVSGMQQAVGYVKSYGFEDLEILVSEDASALDVDDVDRVEVGWLTGQQAVVVPKDRNYLGTVGVFGESHYTVIVHNPSRGMAIIGL